MIILVDMDGVLADWEAHFLAEWRRLHPDKPWIPLGERRAFYASSEYPPEAMDVPRREGFYRDLPPVGGAIDAIAAMKVSGVDVVICTAPMSNHPTCAQEKFAWVAQYLGREWVDRIVIAKDKTFVRGDVLIDDRPDVVGAFVPTWEHVLFDAPYNARVTGKRRMTWETWRETLR